MRKFFYVIALVVIFLLNTSAIVTAEFSDKTDWIDKNYKFSGVKYVFVCDVDTSIFNNLEDDFVNQIQNEYEIIVVSKLKNVVLVDSDDVADMKIISKITAWETESEYFPEQVYYVGWERKRVRNKDGKEIIRNQYKESHTHFFGSRKIVVPAHYVYDSLLRVSFEVYDTKSGTLVMKRNDKRTRINSSGNHLAMFKNSCKAFYSNLGKKLK